jgi:hypothetical protein
VVPKPIFPSFSSMPTQARFWSAVSENFAALGRTWPKAPGIEEFEQCSVASREQGTKVAKVLPEIHVVGNGFISLMAYQAKGYAYIAP